MPNLIETYSRSTGLKIDKPWLNECFWPLSFDKFITLSAGSGQAAKNYDNFQLVIDLLNPVIAPLGIRIVQLGDKNTPLYSGTHDLRGKMNIAQSTYLIKRAVAHLGNDSWSAHVAGFVETPLCALYGTTDKVLHGPHWYNKDKMILLESHRWGRKPTFGAEQNPKSVNTIPPEDIANAIFSLLGLPNRINHKTQFIGSIYNHTIFDWIPNEKFNFNLGLEVPITVRMDLHFNEENLISLLQSGHKATIITNKPINIQVLHAFRGNILSYNHEISEDCPLDFLYNVKRIISNTGFFTRNKDEEFIKNLRFKFFDIVNVEQVLSSTKQDFIRESALYLNISEDEVKKNLDNPSYLDTMIVNTNKFILSNSKIFLSYSDIKIDKSIPDISVRSTKIIDSDEFWKDINHYMLCKH